MAIFQELLLARTWLELVTAVPVTLVDSIFQPNLRVYLWKNEELSRMLLKTKPLLEVILDLTLSHALGK